MPSGPKPLPGTLATRTLATHCTADRICFSIAIVTALVCRVLAQDGRQYVGVDLGDIGVSAGSAAAADGPTVGAFLAEHLGKRAQLLGRERVACVCHG